MWKPMLSCCRHFHTSRKCIRKEALHSAKGRKLGSTQWLTRQINDPYVKLAKSESYRCRSAFKLLEVDDKFKILNVGDRVVDCGAAPGSWTQVAVQRTKSNEQDVNNNGIVISVDLQDMLPIDGSIMLSNSDFTSVDVQGRIIMLLENERVDTVLSDMAPKASGIKALDNENITKLVLSAFKFSQIVLKEGGTFLCKIWQGAEEERLKTLLKQHFKQIKTVKPKASRTDSAEAFILARNFIRTKP